VIRRPSSSCVAAIHTFFFSAIEPDYLAKAIAAVMPVRLREVIELVPARIHAARRNGMQ
jgi:hypothetical protein